MGEGFVLVGPALMPNTERGLRDPHPFSLEQRDITGTGAIEEDLISD